MAEEKTQTYMLKSGRHSRWEDGAVKTYAPGDQIELTAAQAASLDGRLGAPSATVVVGQQFDKDAGRATTEVNPTPAAATPAPAPAAAPEEKNVDQVRDQLKTMSSADQVRAVITAEKASKNRKGVIDAAETRLTEIVELGG